MTELAEIEIDRLEAGREMDELIIMHVLGLQIVNDYREAPAKPYCLRWSILHNEVNYYPIDYIGWSEREPFRPSTDIAAAWMVVEKHPYYFSLVRTNDTDSKRTPFGDVHWRCRFYAPEKFEARANTPELVICRAALKAIRATQESQQA